MSKRGGLIPPDMLRLDPEAPLPIHRQLYDELRRAILSGRISGGAALPSTRALARALGISRATVVSAYEQLLAEGYVEGKIGAGTYVVHVLPESYSTTATPTSVPPTAQPTTRRVAKRAEFFQKLKLGLGGKRPISRAFWVGVPAIDAFPMNEWRHITSNSYRKMPDSLLGYGETIGYSPLREVLADYLRTSRAVNCSPEQVIIMTGARQALDMTMRILTDPGDSVWLEDPGYLSARGVFAGNELTSVPVPIDAEGMNFESVIDETQPVRLAYVTPSHQFPLGVTMSLARRLALLEWANRSGTWIVEDDYDSEFHYKGRPLPSLQGLDTDNRVIYIGSFSKVLFPGLRLGYLIAPPDLVETFANAHTMMNWHPSTLDQAVVADYITGGYFERHIRRMRTLYAERQGLLLEQIRRLGTPLDVAADDAGMHLVGWLPGGIQDQVAAQQAMQNGVVTPALSYFRIQQSPAQGVLLGYTATDEPTIREGVINLTKALTELL